MSSIIDPSILLASKPVQVETPIAAATGAQNLRNLGTQNQIQQGTIQQQAANVAATELENQQKTLALQNQQATNAAIAQNIKQDPATGKPYIDHSGVIQSLTQAGKGQAALAYQQNATAVQQGVAKLADENQKLAAAHAQNLGAIAGSILDTPAAARPTVYALAVHSAVMNHQIQPGEVPDQYDPSIDPRLQQLREAGQTAEQQVQAKQAAVTGATGQQNAASSARRADAAEERADAYQQWITQKGDADENGWKPGWVRNGHQILVNKNGDTKDAGPVDMAPDASGRSGLTAAQQAIQDRADAREQRADRADMDKIHQQRTAIGGALAAQKGSNYIDPKTGKIAPQPMDDNIRNELQQQYVDATNAGRRIQAKWGWNELGPAPQQQQQPAAAPARSAPAQSPASAQSPAPAAAPKPAAAPAGDPNETISVQTPDGKYLSGPRAKVTAYLASKGLKLKP